MFNPERSGEPVLEPDKISKEGEEWRDAVVEKPAEQNRQEIINEMDQLMETRDGIKTWVDEGAGTPADQEKLKEIMGKLKVLREKLKTLDAKEKPQ
ncbi:MAG: hypothetical protein NTY04_00820 [Candidatus Staskawiczbacteria bacterium]|nr:hypothetical protein [Candidatus Staskawiczbacteria bacterium]